MSPTRNIYQKVVYTSAEYLGPAAERFIRRQIVTHLDKRPEDLTAHDLAKLSKWVKQTFALLTENQELVEAFARDLDTIVRSGKKQSRNGKVA